MAATTLVGASGVTIGAGEDVPTNDRWDLVWSDEFDGPAGARPDAATWGYDLGDGSAIGLTGWGNLERQWYTDDPSNVSTDGEGQLVLTVREADGSLVCYYGPCGYTSARLVSRDRLEVRYGRLEARILVPAGVGLWPAFWMLGSDIDEVGWPAAGEIDVLEFFGRRPTELLGSAHGPGYSGSSGISRTVDLGEPVGDAFHTFAIEWWPRRVTWSVDGSRFHEVTSQDVAPHEWVFDHPFFLQLNVAVSGNLGGPVAPDTPFPQQMLVDYVRLYQQDPR